MARGKLFVKYDIFTVKRLVRKARVGVCYYKPRRDSEQLGDSRHCSGDSAVFKSVFGGATVELCNNHFKEVRNVEAILIKNSNPKEIKDE